jgi:hypothetical protein
MSSWSWKAGLAGVAIVAASAYAVAQMGPEHSHMQHERMMQGQHGTKGAMGPDAMKGQKPAPGARPTMPGQDAFGTIQEIVQILEADPATDWSKVSIVALRQHLIDMNEVTLNAAANERPLDNGIEITVTGAGRTRDAIKRMVPAHANELTRLGWNATTEQLTDGVKLVVTTANTKEVAKLKALGLMGIMVQGAHHQAHHLAMARGELIH